MNISTIKNAIIGSVSKYADQPITEGLLEQIQHDLYDLAKPIGQEGIISLEYTDENYTDVNGCELFLDRKHWVLLNLFFLLCLKWTNTLVVNDLHEAYTLTIPDVTKRLDSSFYISIGNIALYVKDGKVCVKRA